MIESLMLRSDYVQMAKAVHSACGSISTVFLTVRLWARKKNNGLWWDDYLREQSNSCL